MKVRQKHNRRFEIAIFLLAIALSLTGCFWPEEDPPASFEAPSTTFSSVPIAVGTETYTVARGDVTHVFSFGGTVQAGAKQEIFFAEEGRVATIFIESGATVNMGDLVAELESDQAEMDLAEAQLHLQLATQQVDEARSAAAHDLDVAQLNLQAATVELNHMQWNTETPREDIDLAQSRMDIAQAEVEQAQANQTGGKVLAAQIALQLAEYELIRAQRSQDRLELTAPMTGTVRLSQDLRVGRAVQAYAPVAEIVDTRSLVIESNLAVADLANLYEGMPVTIEVANLPGMIVQGNVVSLPQPYGNGNTAFARVAPDTTTSSAALREGIAVTINAEIGHKSDVLTLPNAAIQTVGGRQYVVIDDGGQLREQEISVGLVGDKETEIVDGLSEGDVVYGP